MLLIIKIGVLRKKNYNFNFLLHLKKDFVEILQASNLNEK